MWVKKRKFPLGFLTFFPNRLGIFNQFLHTYYTFLSTLDYKFLFNYLQLWWSYAILSATTQQMFTFQRGILRRKSAADARWRLQTVASIWIRISARRSSSSHARQTQEWLKVNCTDFITKDQWPPNSPDLNPLDYHVCGAMLQAFHKPVKAKDHPRAKKCTAADMGWLATDNNQQNYQRLANVWTRAFQPMVDILSIWCELGGRA